jgi:NADPH:quinone reductase-like Zn-dependent oxidoreductase
MKAAQINEYGHADKIAVVEVDAPTATEGTVVIQVQAASINPFDTVVREGYMKEMIPLDLPVTLGGDIAGVIAEVGKDVANLQVGDTVYGQANVVAGNSGAFAEFARTSSTQVAKAPSNLTIQQAASLPLVGVSALQALLDHINLQSGQKLFIHGGAGGIGSIAIQVAKHLGAYVTTTATGDGIDFVESLGADEVIDYKAEDFSEKLSDFDAVFELAGGKEFDKTLTILKKGGVAVSMNAQANEAKATELGVTAISQMTQVTSEKLEKLTQLVEEGIVTPQNEKTFSLAEISKAFEARESGSVKGKIVIAIA